MSLIHPETLVYGALSLIPLALLEVSGYYLGDALGSAALGVTITNVALAIIATSVLHHRLKTS